MSRAKSKATHPAPPAPRRTPKVRIARCGKRPIQLRYFDPAEQREVRISTQTRDQAEAERQKEQLEARLLLGLETQPKKIARSPAMDWHDFRESYSRLKVATFRSEDAKESAEVRLDIVEAIVHPKTLADMAAVETLAELQAELLAGTGGKKGPRSASTVKSYMQTLRAALNWGHKMRWLPERCEFELVDTETAETLKGRPLTDDEFQQMLAACDRICAAGADSWRFLLRGLWESGLRLGESMVLSWDDQDYIVPLRTRRRAYLLRIPGRLQKSRKTQEVPTTPAFGQLLDEVPEESRTGWVFNPQPRRGWPRRLTEDQVGRIISDIGEAAGVFVNSDGKPASAHDLRRSFGQRMADAGLPTRDLQNMMRHSSIATTEKYYLRHRAVDQAERIAAYLGTAAAVEQKKDLQPSP